MNPRSLARLHGFGVIGIIIGGSSAIVMASHLGPDARVIAALLGSAVGQVIGYGVGWLTSGHQ